MRQKIKILSIMVLIFLGLDTISFALDSSAEMPPSTQRKVRGTSIPQATITNNQYTSIAACGTPNCSNSYNSSTTKCPDVCSVTIVVSNDQVTAPVCPAGYMQTASFNSQPEYVYQSGDSTKLYPTSWESYNAYKNSTAPIYTENYDNTNAEWTSSCLDASRSYAYDGQTFYNTGTDSTYVMRDGKLTKLRGIYVNCYSAACGGSGWGYYSGTATYPTNSSQVAYCLNSSGNCCDTAATKHVIYRYKNVYFTKNAGNVPSGRYLPGTIICAHVKTTWEN